jgi:hypothetical protein
MLDLLECKVNNCIFCKKQKILHKGVCGACRKDINERVDYRNEEDEEEMGVCISCKEKTILFKSGICWACYKRVCDDYNRDKIRQDYNCRL